MASTKGNTFKPSLHAFEERLTPATALWPFPKVGVGAIAEDWSRVLSTYGQYQDFVQNGRDDFLHMHEGLDILAPAGTPVVAVADGRVVGGSRTGVPYNDFVSIRDEGSEHGWNYKHIEFTRPLNAPDFIPAGTVLGRVAANPLGAALSHIHLDRGTQLDKVAVKGASRFAPNVNPLFEFPGAVDAVKPTIGDVHVRVGSDGGLRGKQGVDYKHYNQATDVRGWEVMRRNVQYFDDTVMFGGENLTHVGRYATAVADDRSKTSVGSKDNKTNHEVDLVVEASDRMGAAGSPSANKLGVYRMGFKIDGANGKTSGFIPAFNFNSTTRTGTFQQALNLTQARQVYANDSRSNSALPGPFWYVPTNSGAVTGAFDKGFQGFNTSARDDYSWNTMAPAGEKWSSPNKAAGNAVAAFPDGKYTITINAWDVNNNKSADKVVSLFVNNWDQTVKVSKVNYAPTDVVRITGGAQFLPNSRVDIYVLDAPAGSQARPDAGAYLSGKRITVTAGADGRLPAADLESFAVGSYWLVADYDQDGRYTPELDAATRFGVGAPVLKETVAVDLRDNTAGNMVAFASRMQAGRSYMLRVSGEGKIAQGKNGGADAEYIRFTDDGGYQDGSSPGYPWVDHGIRVVGHKAGAPAGSKFGVVNHWGGYRGNHVYEANINGFNGTLSAFFKDISGYYGDNSGELTIELYEYLPPGDPLAPLVA